MGTKLTRGNEFSFPKEHGFTGSCGGSAVTGYMRGGHIGKKATVRKGKSTPHPFAKGGRKEVEHKDYDDKNDTSDAADYPEVGTRAKPDGYAKGGKMHLNPAHKGKFTRAMGKKEGHLMGKDVSRGLHSKSGEVRKEANFARMARRHFKPLAEGGGVDREPKGTPSVPYDEDAKGGRVHSHAKGGQPEIRAGRINLKSERRETHHREHGVREEVQRHHDHHGKAKHREGHTTPHPFAYGGRMPGAVMGSKHRARMNPTVSAAAPVMRAPAVRPPAGIGALAGSTPGAGAAPGAAVMPGLKRGGRR